jgi:hypothetical protein
MAKDRAVSFLREQLAGGPVATTELEARAKAEGLSWASLRRAKQQLKIEAIRESHGIGGDGRWVRLTAFRLARLVSLALGFRMGRHGVADCVHGAAPVTRLAKWMVRI